jgi:hypothetical protein
MCTTRQSRRAEQAGSQHGGQSVALIRNPQEAGTRKPRRGAQAMRNPAKAFDKAKNTWEEQVIAAMEEQSQIDHSEAHSILEVQVALASNLT